MRIVMRVFLLAALAFGLAADTDISGTWTGSFSITRSNGDSNDGTALLVLKQAGTEITGTVGPDDGQQFPIQKGTIDGDKITLEVQHESHIIKFELVLADGHIRGEANLSGDGQTAKAKLDVTRAPKK